MCVYIHIYVLIHVDTYTSTNMDADIYMDEMFIWITIYVCVYTHIYILIHVDTYTHTNIDADV